jgi:hypothetical protein
VTRTVTGPPRLHRRVWHAPRVCRQCRWPFTPARADAVYCSHACRTRAWRLRRWHFALITWRPYHGSWDAQWKYFESYAQAAAAAPSDEPFTVVNVNAKPKVPLPSVPEIIRRTRLILGDDPYRPTLKGDLKWLS